MPALFERKRASLEVIWPDGEVEYFDEAERSVYVEGGYVIIINHQSGRRTIVPMEAEVTCYPDQDLYPEEIPGDILTEGRMTVEIQSRISNEFLERAYRTIKSVGGRVVIFRHSNSVMTLPSKDAKVMYEKE